MRQRRGPLVWSEGLAYALGLIATDGCLSPSRRHVCFTSKDADLIETLCDAIGSYPTVQQHRGPKGTCLRATFSDVELYRWLLDRGLTPRKSLTLGPLQVPDEYLLPVVRGLLDGDGSIINTTVVPNRRRYPQHQYRRLQVVFLSASRTHVEWIQQSLLRALGVAGTVFRRERPPHHALYQLKYGKHAAITLLGALCADAASPRLLRKWRIWDAYQADPPKTRLWTRRSDEMADVIASRAIGRKPVRVRVPPPAPVMCRDIGDDVS